MSDLETLTGLGEQITIKDKKYRLPPINAGDWALVKEHILSLRADPVDVVTRLADHAPADVARALFEKAYDDATRARIVTSRDFDDFVYSVEGRQFIFWIRLRRNHPEVTADQAAVLCDQWVKQELLDALEIMMKRFPDASREELEKVQAQEEDAITMAMVARGLGFPEGNCSTPETPGTRTARPTGPDGTPT